MWRCSYPLKGLQQTRDDGGDPAVDRAAQARKRNRTTDRRGPQTVGHMLRHVPGMGPAHELASKLEKGDTDKNLPRHGAEPDPRRRQREGAQHGDGSQTRSPTPGQHPDGNSPGYPHDGLQQLQPDPAQVLGSLLESQVLGAIGQELVGRLKYGTTQQCQRDDQRPECRIAQQLPDILERPALQNVCIEEGDDCHRDSRPQAGGTGKRFTCQISGTSGIGHFC